MILPGATALGTDSSQLPENSRRRDKTGGTERLSTDRTSTCQPRPPGI
ncbi:MAG: hypothetical protein SGJ27_28305 [Candidatus Melainabacteria bacterium]|nr:hypothetical protein [Candidatus Melainabacteria bacterium]